VIYFLWNDWTKPKGVNACGCSEASGKGKARSFILGKRLYREKKRTVQDVRKLSASQAYAVMKKLQKEGKITRLNGRKYSKYKLMD